MIGLRGKSITGKGALLAVSVTPDMARTTQGSINHRDR